MTNPTPTPDLLVAGNAFKSMLSYVSPETQIKALTQEVMATKSVSKKDVLIKKIKYLNGLAKTGLKASEAYVIHNIPVVPPQIRPVTVMGGNRVEYADVNSLYKDHMLVNNSLRDIKDMLPDSELIKEREDAYNGVKAIIGLGEAISPNSRGRNMKGLLRQVAGTTGPKTGFFHSKILSKKQDFSGRATIYAEPNLDYNQAAIPSDQLWVMYKLHILRDLAKQGYDYVNAEKAYSEHSATAVNSFNKLIKQIPIIINRAPTLMKSNISAVYPVPIQGTAMGINPIHLPMFAGDFDGDALSMYLPMSPEAVEEAKTKLLPMAQIHDYRRGIGKSIVAPGHEAILGSVHMTTPTEATIEKPVHHFKTEEDCLKALAAGEILETDPVEIG
jgi:DNA-directed RNA polymerase subunit beta'